jgi:hypothetical protein
MMDDVEWLQTWYQSCCNGRWEHQYGVKIDTLDNPGWKLRIDLVGTPLDGRAMEAIESDRSGTDWLFCGVQDGAFIGRCDPSKLTKLIAIFREWSSRKDKS